MIGSQLQFCCQSVSTIAPTGPVFVDPEELLGEVRSAGHAPPPVEVGGFPEPGGGIFGAHTVQQRGGESEEVEADHPLLAHAHALSVDPQASVCMGTYD